ncbi:MAG: hypothetical protein HC836_25865 [Richelia sp. RM2_1_2]|nr:hypothetical protein [Richelia sp. RM2_1_2]
MKVRTIATTGLVLAALGGCVSTSQESPLYGEYENIDNQSLCLGIMAFVADYPSVVWLKKSKGFYAEKKEQYGIQSAALYKIAVKRYGKQDAAERGIAGYSSAKSLVYVLGPSAVLEALNRCEPVAQEAVSVDSEYQNFLKHLESEKPDTSVNPNIVVGDDTQLKVPQQKETTIFDEK